MARRIAIAAAGPEPGGTRALAGALVRSAAAGAAPATAPHLLVRTGPRAGARVPLRPALTLGRGRDADLALPDPKASRVHARVAVGAASVTVEDLASKNGLRVNGERVGPGTRPLRPGDELTVGDTTLRLEDPLRVLESSPRAGADEASAHLAPVEAGTSRGAAGRVRRSPLTAAALLALAAAALALAS